MVRKKSGKKGKVGKSTGVEDSSVHQDTAGGNENLQDGGAPPTSSSSNNNLEYEATFSLLDSKDETRNKKPKAKNHQGDVIPAEIDLTGFLEEETKESLKHHTRSSDKSPPEKPKKKQPEQEAEAINHYILSQVEVINVDAKVPFMERELQRLEIGKTVWKTYGEDLVVYAGTADFLLYLTGELEEDSNKVKAASSTTQSTKYVDHFGPFTIVSLYYMRQMAHSQLFKALTERNILKHAIGCQFNKWTLTYTARF